VQETTNFVILGTQRTGTTLVRTSLSSHPNILCCGEVFNLGKRPYSKPDGYWHYSRQDFNRRLKALFNPQKMTAGYLEQLYSSEGYSAIGFKFMLSDCLTRPYIWPLLLNRNVKAILVSRRNSLKTLVSRRSASASGIYHISKTLNIKTAVETWTPRKITINTKTVIDDLSNIELECSLWRTRLDNVVEHIDVVYEEYAGSIDAGNRRILEFLDVPQLQLTSDLKKINPDNLGDLISNYDDLAKVLKGTKYAKYLDAS